MDLKNLKVFVDHGFHFSRMISGSKSAYINKFPENRVVFNARIYDSKTYEKEKNHKIKDFFEGQSIEIWYGDLDLTKDEEELQKIANEIGTFVITTEHGEYVDTFKKGD